MLLLASAVVFHFGVCRGASRHIDATLSRARLTGGLGLLLWFGVAVAGCAFILLE